MPLSIDIPVTYLSLADSTVITIKTNLQSNSQLLMTIFLVDIIMGDQM